MVYVVFKYNLFTLQSLTYLLIFASSLAFLPNSFPTDL